MNQSICPNCRTSNTPDKSFCVTCGHQLAAAQQGFQGNAAPNAFGGAPNMPGGFTPMQTPAPKKSRLGLWLAILGGAAVLIVLIGGVGLAGLLYYFSTSRSSTDYNYNSPSNLSQSNSSLSNTNVSPNNSTLTAEMTEDEKYRLFYAASKVNESALTMKVSKRIGIIDESNKPTEYYKTFTAGMFKWAMRDADFVKRIDTKQKAIDYINSVMPGAATSSTSSKNNFSLGVINGKATNLVTPAYPAAAKAVKASGTVNVQVTLDETGNVTTASSVSGHPLLRASAEQAARASKFSPAMMNGQSVKATGIVVYNFVAE
jgi:TonB family protein